MPNQIGSADFVLRVNSTDFDRGVRNAKTSAVGLKDSFNLVSAALASGVVAALASVGKAAFDSFRQIQTLHQNFTTLLGSQQQADTFVETMRDLSNSTTLTFDAVGSAAKQLLAFGVAADEVEGVIGRLGDAALGDSETMERLARAYGQMRAGLVANLEDINQFIDAGVPLLQALAKEVGVAESEIKALISTGTVGFDKVEAALRSMTEAGGLYEGAMEDAANTIDGRLNKAMGELDILLADVFSLITNEGQAVITLIENIGNLVAVVSFLNQELTKLKEKVPALELLNKIGSFNPFTGSLFWNELLPFINSEIEKLGHTAQQTKFHFDELNAAMNASGVGQVGTETQDAASTEGETERIVTSLQYRMDQYRLYGQTRIESNAEANAAILEANTLAEQEAEQALQKQINGYRLYGRSRVEAEQDALAEIAAANQEARDKRLEEERASAEARRQLEEETNNMVKASFKDAYETITDTMNIFGRLATKTYQDTAKAAKKASGEEQEALKEKAMEQWRLAVGLFRFNQAASAATTLINSWEGFSKSIAAYPWPFNLIPAAASLAEGLAKQALIWTQQPPPRPFAEGGVVTAPTVGLIGEAGPEAVFPLDRLEEMGYGKGEVKVVIQGPFYGTQVPEEFAEEIEKALKRRNNF